MLRPGEILQPVEAEVFERGSARQVVHQQFFGRLRHEDLPSMPGRQQPGTSVQRLAVILALSELGFP